MIFVAFTRWSGTVENQRCLRTRCFFPPRRTMFTTCARINYLRCRQMATFVSRWPNGERMCESCARSLRAVDPSTRNLSRTQADLWLRFPWTFVIHSVSKSSWQLLSTTRHWTILTFIPPVSCKHIFRTPPSAPPHFRLFEFFPQLRPTILLSYFARRRRRRRRKDERIDYSRKFFVYNFRIEVTVDKYNSVRECRVSRDESGYRFTEFRVASIN